MLTGVRRAVGNVDELGEGPPCTLWRGNLSFPDASSNADVFVPIGPEAFSCTPFAVRNPL